MRCEALHLQLGPRAQPAKPPGVKRRVRCEALHLQLGPRAQPAHSQVRLFFLGLLVRAGRRLHTSHPLSHLPSHSQVRLFFSAFSFEQGVDFVRVYDGATTSHPLLATLTGYDLPQV